jgi:iron complex outermembrane receptor protein/hemoglobin/transferrin/lactoferrin receptor protein
VTLRPHDAVRLHVNVDQGFRAPNLDDLTSRQQVGPGFQLDNPALEPERTLTTEVGLRVLHPVVRFDVWGFATTIDRGIQRSIQEGAVCPPETPGCASARTTFQLVNATDRSVLLGMEGGLTLALPRNLRVRATASYAYGQGPDLNGGPERRPLSRVPPLQGTLQLRWRHRATGLSFGGALRWSDAQGRLAVADASDPRIPLGGTPGYAVIDLRAGWRFRNDLALSLVFENVADAAYRIHGSSINGPGRSVMLWLRAG